MLYYWFWDIFEKSHVQLDKVSNDTITLANSLWPLY